MHRYRRDLSLPAIGVSEAGYDNVTVSGNVAGQLQSEHGNSPERDLGGRIWHSGAERSRHIPGLENLGKLQPRADIGIFIGYAPSRKGYRIYKKQTRKIMETIHVQFDELTEQMAPVQSSPGPAPNLLTLEPISSGPVPNPAHAIPYDPIPNVAQDPVIPTGLLVSISFDLDAPSGSHISSPLDHHSSSVHHGVAGEQYAEVNPLVVA
ncbi:hypothetical protein Tco_0756370 [Tanacetum coccineum]